MYTKCCTVRACVRGAGIVLRAVVAWLLHSTEIGVALLMA